MKCSRCDNKECYGGKDCTDLSVETLEIYKNNPQMLKMAEAGSFLEANYYMQLTRIEEFILFCSRMDFKKIGIAFCIGLSEEARLLDNLLCRYFEIYSACCKLCGIAKEEFNFDKIDNSRFEAMCNPAGQALALNKSKTDINVIFGLCVGHDIVFSQNSSAPVTTLLVKDRVLAHNPMGVLYSNYYRKRITERIERIGGLRTKRE